MRRTVAMLRFLCLGNIVTVGLTVRVLLFVRAWTVGCILGFCCILIIGLWIWGLDGGWSVWVLGFSLLWR